jgi:arylsulfatase A-like enzyme
MFVQHTDVAATILDAVGVTVPERLHGRSFLETAVAGHPGPRDHVTVGWGSTPTVITDRWWLNCKVDGTGVLLYDLKSPDPFERSVGDDHPDVVRELFALAEQDAGGEFPEWLVTLARQHADAPGCSEVAARA